MEEGADLEITAFVALHDARVLEIARRARGRGLPIDALAILVLDVSGRVGATRAWSGATRDDVCVWAASIETAVPMVGVVDAEIANALVEPATRGAVRVVVATLRAFGLTHLVVPMPPIAVA